jgi:CHAD domain-containing protein
MPHTNHKKGAACLVPAAERRTRVQAVLADFFSDLAVLAPTPTPAQVHHIRVEIKKLRSWIRLLRLAEKRHVGVAANRDLRATAQAFASSREQHVLEHTLDLVLADCRHADERVLLTDLLPLIRQPAMPVTAPRFTQTSTRRLQALCTRQPKDEVLLRGLTRSYRRARRLGKRACAKSATPELRHRWRKRVKDLQYQLQFTCVARHGKVSSWRRALADLGTALGQLQDIHVLELRLAAATAANADAIVLASRLLACARKRELASVTRLRRRCFAAKQPPFKV